jgi:short-subunit dehydrogenase
MADQTTRPRVIVITGASSGIGRGTAVGFAASGATVVLAARRLDVLEEVAAACVAAGGNALTVPTDVSDAGAVQALARAAVDHAGVVDVWVNDAGVAALGRFDEIPLADHTQVIATDLLGVLYGSYFALQRFRQQGAGILINVSSLLGKVSAPYYASYVAAKFGIVGLNAALRQELAENGDKDIHVCTVLPMSMDTPFFDHAANYSGHEAVPIPPVFDPAEVVDAIVKLADEPKAEVIVGRGGAAMSTFHAVAPGLTEKMLGFETHKVLIETAPPVPPTPGALHAPVADGTGIHGDSR